ncbi:MAG: hypothetical protein KF780_00930 [Sphingomonas sp.]|nr:hypothetical protein [Sphingomonas sp.]
MTFIALPFAIGAIGFGLAGFLHGDFWLQWQLVPESLPARAPLALFSNALLVAGGAMLLWRPLALWGALLLAGSYGLWAIVVHAARLAAHPLNAGVWLAFTEVVTFAVGGAVLALLLTGGARPVAMRAARIVFAGCAFVFGLCHFVYLDITAGMVPAWMPGRHFLAALTGAAHIAAAASLASGVLSRLAAALFTAMVASFALLVHIPRVIGDPASHMEWAMLFIAVSLAGAAWILRTGIAAHAGPGEGSKLSWIRARRSAPAR